MEFVGELINLFFLLLNDSIHFFEHILVEPLLTLNIFLRIIFLIIAFFGFTLFFFAWS
jgi:hypothetical protein